MAVGKNEKLESLKLESFCLSWKEPSEVGKNRAKLESTTEVGKWLMKLESLNWTLKDSMKLERSIELGKLNWYKNAYACF